ncbi:YndM family protein [Planococcus sp. 11815]|uniref:DUF2512 family protein n=1 Tax=Planococcus sp. 11815 TaxID=2939413 RepID=UPI003DA293A0
MKHIEAILMKFAMSFAVVFLILGLIYGVSVFNIFIISLVITAIGYAGDMLIFPRTSNKLATGGDLVLAFVIVWLLGEFLIEKPDSPYLQRQFTQRF